MTTRTTKEWRIVLRLKESREEGHRIRYWHKDHYDKEEVREVESNSGYRIWFTCRKEPHGQWSIWRPDGDDRDVGPEDE